MLALWNPTKVGAKQFHRVSNFASKIISQGKKIKVKSKAMGAWREEHIEWITAVVAVDEIGKLFLDMLGAIEVEPNCIRLEKELPSSTLFGKS